MERRDPDRRRGGLIDVSGCVPRPRGGRLPVIWPLDILGEPSKCHPIAESGRKGTEGLGFSERGAWVHRTRVGRLIKGCFALDQQLKPDERLPFISQRANGPSAGRPFLYEGCLWLASQTAHGPKGGRGGHDA